MALSGEVLAVDGKTVRDPHRGEQRALHLVSAYGSGLGMVLAHVRPADRSNEITAIPELLDALLLKGATVTIDAMGRQNALPARSTARRLAMYGSQGESVGAGGPGERHL